jgi:glucose-1-phosphate thymidylyltransferase
MRGVVLAGGLGTRLRPLTSVTNKHLLPVYGKPMIFYPLGTLADAGIKEVMVVVGGQSTGEIVRLLKDGSEFKFKRLYYAYQEGEGGIAAALSLCEEFVDGHNCCVILGDNVLEDSIKFEARDMDLREFGTRATIFTAKVEDPENYGCVDWKYLGTRIIEKANPAPSRDAVIGVYMYDPTVFNKIRTLKPSKRGELEITDVNNAYFSECYDHVKIVKTSGYWGDAGSSVEALVNVSQAVMERSRLRKVLA